MLILVSVVVTTSINGGLFNYAGKAVNDTKISSEKSTLSEATLLAISENKYGKIEKETLQKKLDKIIGEGKTIVYDTGNGYEIFFEDSGLYYELSKSGKIGDYKTGVTTKITGNIFVDENGKVLDGEESPYQIKSIEDLVVLANLANGAGNYINADGEIENIETYNNFSGKNIELTRTLNFNSPTSYADLKLKWSYDEEQDAYKIDENSETNLMEIITDKDGVGFVPINNNDAWGGTEISLRRFKGSFNGCFHEIQNIFENRADLEFATCGLFGGFGGTIKNLKLLGNFSGKTGGFTGGSINGRFINCSNGISIHGTGAYGGMTVRAAGSLFINCVNLGDIVGGAVGGMCNTHYGDDGNLNIINCCNTGKLTNLSNGSYPWFGGMAGVSYKDAKIYNCLSLRAYE